MRLEQLEISDVRNLNQFSLTCGERFNFIFGQNGTGKTTLLECFHLLGVGRSFRTHLKQPLIQFGKKNLSVFGKGVDELHQQPIRLGIQKSLGGETLLKVNGEEVHSLAEFARWLPIQLLRPEDFELIMGQNLVRRQFIDWGVFHVEPSFYPLWNQIQRGLKQRNAALKQQRSFQEIESWDTELSEWSRNLHRLREDYFQQLLPLIQEFYQAFQDLPEIECEYWPGWSVDFPLEEQWQRDLEKDLREGYTRIGPHRAHLEFTFSKKPAKEILSRGQQKIWLFILRFAQGTLLHRQTGKLPLYLIDDFIAELDARRREELFEVMAFTPGQFFMTGTQVDSLPAKASSLKMTFIELL